MTQVQTLAYERVAVTAANFRWKAAVIRATVAGLVCVALADAASVRGYSNAGILFWIGLLLVFVPTAIAVLRPGAERRERLQMILLLGLALYLVKLFGSPTAFSFSDEFIHLRNTQDILRTHHLFDANPLLPTAAYYPGLAAVTAGVVDLTGLSPFAAGIVVIGLARLLFSGCFFLVAERVTGSDRAAAVAGLVYAANPMFLPWSSTFSYENLALPLAIFVVYWIGRTRYQGRPAADILTVVVIGAIAVTHHVVGFALTALLAGWWLAEHLRVAPIGSRVERRAARRKVGVMALVAGAAVGVWFFVVAKPAPAYLLTNNIVPAVRQTISLLIGQAPRRQLYTSGGHIAPAWETVAGAAAVGIPLLLLAPALHRAWRQPRRAALVVAAAIAVAFPLSLAPRFAPDGVAISGRSAEYVFAGMGCVFGLLAVTRIPTAATKRIAIAVALLTVLFVGDITIGTAFYERLPEKSHPAGYPWSLQRDVIDASKWTRANLGIHRRFGANAIDAFAIATYGEQNPVAEDDVWPIFFSRTINASVVRRIRATGVDYLLLDWRMPEGVPPTPGYYFGTQEPGAGLYQHAFPRAALEKFDRSTCVASVYAQGAVEIIDVTRISDGSCTPDVALVSTRPARRGARR